MKKLLRYTLLFLTVSTLVLMGEMAVYANHASVSSSLTDSTQNNRANNLIEKPVQEPAKASTSFFSSWFFQPFRNNTQSGSEKLLSNVKVFPNPTVETINLSFRLGKRSDVSIKVMDALGNEMLTLFSQTLDPGNQNQSFEIQKRLSSGLYFVRVTAGTETVIKRISVL